MNYCKMEKYDFFLSQFSTLRIISNINLKRYLRFIFSRSQKFEGYTELHHILPKSLFPDLANSKFNLVRLTAREHFIAHLMLARFLGGRSWLAVFMMVNSITPHLHERKKIKISSRTYALVRNKVSEEMSKTAKDYRKSETDEQKIERVRKWKENFANKTADEKQSIWDKMNKTASARRQEMGPKTRSGTLKELKSSFGNSIISCVICKRGLNDKRSFDKHVELCLQRAEKANKRANKKYHRELKSVRIKLLKALSRIRDSKHKNAILQNKTCKICNKVFTSPALLRIHESVKNCHLTQQEKVALSRARAKETMDAFSESKKRTISETVSRGRKKYFQNLTPEQLAARNEKTKNAMLDYYSGENYEAEYRSERIKEGLKNAKNNKN